MRAPCLFAKENDLDYILIDGEYKIDMALF